MNLTVVYPAKPGSRFDFAYYRDRHAPLVAEVWKPQSMEVLKGAVTLDGSPVPYVLLATFRFASRAELEAALGHSRGPELMADVAHFTDIAPQILLTEALG